MGGMNRLFSVFLLVLLTRASDFSITPAQAISYDYSGGGVMAPN